MINLLLALFIFFHPVFPEGIELIPDLEIGGFGSGELDFKTPGALVTSGNYIYVVDEGNRRIQQISLDGTFIAESSEEFPFIPKYLAIDLSKQLYVGNDEDKDMTLLANNLVPIFTLSSPNGMMGISQTGTLYIYSKEQLKFYRFSLSTQKVEELNFPPSISQNEVLDLCLVKDNLWILTASFIIQSDLFGAIQKRIPIPQTSEKGHLQVLGENKIFALLDLDCYLLNQKTWKEIGKLPDSVKAGGAVIIANYLWVSDQNKHQLLRFPISIAK